jgi:glycopeptide antibiotics resistance protein
MSNRIWRVLWAASILIIAAAVVLPLTNFKAHSHWGRVRWIPFMGIALSPIELGANIALFLPFGFTYAKAWPGASNFRVVGGGAILSALSELYQVYCHSRIPSTTDICTNTLGALCGMLIARRFSNES